MENNESANGQLLKTKSEFDITDSAFATLMFVVLSVIFSFALSIFNVKVKMGSFFYFVLHILVESIFAIAAVIVAKIKKRTIIDSAGMNKKVNGVIVGWSFLVALISLLCFANLTNVFIAFLEKFGLKTDSVNIEINNFGQYLGMLVSSCAVAGFSEELLFRGVIQSGFKKWGIKISVGVSALIFMIMHGSVLQTIHQFIIGIVIGYIFYKTNNLWIGVIIHFFNNFIPVTETYLLTIATKAETVTEAATETASVGFGSILISLIMALFMAWAGYYFIRLIFKKIIKENEKLNENKEEKEVVTSIVVDGAAQEVEMTIDGTVQLAENPVETKQAEKPTISGGAIAMFSVAGLYLLLEWILGTISFFM